jgi:hypothetical protein
MLYGLFLITQMKSIAQGAATTIVAATAAEYGKNGSAYLADCQPNRGHRLSRDPGACRNLWDMSEALVGEKGHTVDHSLLSSSQPPLPMRSSASATASQRPATASQRPSKS